MTAVRRTGPTAPAASATGATRLGRVLAGGTTDEIRRLEFRGIGPAALRLLRRREEEEVDVAVAKWIATRTAEIGLGTDVLAATGQLPVTKRTIHETIARALRDPDDPTIALGTLEEWAELDDEVLGEIWRAYTDLRAELDPLAAPLSKADAAAILDALAKKNWTLLPGFGAVKLSAYLRTTVEPPAT